MDPDYAANLMPRLLLTVATLGYGLVTMRADFNRTHATNPLWTPHARFHVVWQVLSYAGVALIALGLAWTPGPLAVERLYLAAGLGGAVYGAFFLALLARPLFGGALYDRERLPALRGTARRKGGAVGRERDGLHGALGGPPRRGSDRLAARLKHFRVWLWIQERKEGGQE